MLFMLDWVYIESLFLLKWVLFAVIFLLCLNFSVDLIDFKSKARIRC